MGNGESFGVAISPDGEFVYATATAPDDAVLVIDAATNALAATVPIVGGEPLLLAVTPDGKQLYVTNYLAAGFVSVIDAVSRTVTANIVVGSAPFGVAISPNGALTYVTNQGSDTVSVIDTTVNLVVDSIAVGHGPLGIAVTPFIFAGTPGKPNCHGESVSALARQHGGFERAATSLGFHSVQVLQSAIRTFCQR